MIIIITIFGNVVALLKIVLPVIHKQLALHAFLALHLLEIHVLVTVAQINTMINKLLYALLVLIIALNVVIVMTVMYVVVGIF